MDSNLNLKKMVVPGVVMLAFWTLAFFMWRSSGEMMALFFFGYIGASAGLGLGLYAALPKKKKPLGRRLALFMIGAFLFGFAGVWGAENIQIEGFFFGLLAGVIQASVVHYLIAKIFGPVLFGRLWCGWACWTVMILDLLPFTRPSGRLPGRWGGLRYLHFGLSLALVLLLFVLFGYRDGVTGRTAVIWFLVGNAFYYVIGISLAYALKDNRAFCKYVCPVAVPLKLATVFSLLRVRGEAERCNDCLACVKMCPMDIRIPDYIKNGQRVLSTECSLCQTCITVCAPNALQLSFGLDLGGRDLLRERGREQLTVNGQQSALQGDGRHWLPERIPGE
jgi:ferredoxin-type protein NapH